MILRRASLIPLLSAMAISAQPSFQGCGPLSATDFQVTELLNRDGGAKFRDAQLNEPIGMDFQGTVNPDGSSQVDIYFVQRLGKVRRFNGASGTVTDLGTIPVAAKPDAGGDDAGLMGIALHPDFARNRWIFAWYCPPISADKIDEMRMRLSRFTLSPQGTLDMASEKILIDIPGLATHLPEITTDRHPVHDGGPMAFDTHGDLWVTVGNNGTDLDPAACNVMSATDRHQSGEWGPSNTASLRGGIFRIRPDSSAKGYRIPAGNFGEYWAAQFESQGRTTLAAQYRDTAKVAPQVYVKGSRSNFSISVHPTKRWVAWGEVNYASAYDEVDITAKPMFSGYPYFHADNRKTCNTMNMDPNAPKNMSPYNTGVTELPPAVPASVNGLEQVAIAGPIYEYDWRSASKSKFPPHLDQSLLSLDFARNQMWLHTLDTVAVKVKQNTRIDRSLFPDLRLFGPLQAKYGPDGALYVLNYGSSYYRGQNSGISRIAYKGSCAPVANVPHGPDPERAGVLLFPERLRVLAPGRHAFSLHDLSGRAILVMAGSAGTEYAWGRLLKDLGAGPGTYLVRVRTESGVFEGPISHLH
ncbi:MAG TPA: PQQ-dependent sugar dehydrogenase [Fibrobacteria bacterium]|nr:PQQ-dependent sugar dehydrogenase [Fibrobacteria bacterium]